MKQKLIIILTLLLILPIKVNALSGTLKITCEKSKLTIGESTTCSITGNTDGEVSSIHTVINVSDGLEIVSVTRDSSWEGSDDAVLDLYTDKNKKDTFNIASFVIKATKIGTSSITLTESTLGDASFVEHKFTTSTQNITIENEVENNNSSNNNSSSSSSNPSSSSSPSSNSEPSSSSSSNPSSTTNPTNPNYNIILDNNTISVGKQTSLFFTANTAGVLKVTSGNSNILAISVTNYNLNANETKNVQLTGVQSGTTTITVEFIPTDSKTYNSVTKTYNISIISSNINVEENPTTGNIMLFFVGTLGLFLFGYSFWYYKSTHQN